MGTRPRAKMSSMGARAPSTYSAALKGAATPLDVLGRVEGRRGIDEVDHVVMHLPALLFARLVGRDVEPLVHLARVGDDDLTPDLQRQVECPRGLADARRPDDHRHERAVSQGVLAKEPHKLRASALSLRGPLTRRSLRVRGVLSSFFGSGA